MTLDEATVLDRILDRMPLPFLPGGEIRATVTKLHMDGLIELRETPSGYDLTAKGVDACRDMWPEAEQAFKRFDPNYEPPDPMRGVEFPFAENH